jgi:hypothetical protein
LNQLQRKGLPKKTAITQQSGKMIEYRWKRKG